MAIITGGTTGGGGVGTVTSVSSANTGIAVATPTTTPALTLATLDVIAADGPAAADWSNNSHKITALANGTAASDAAAFGQITAANASAIPSDGWVASADTWTFASATTFTITGVDRTAIFQPGTRLKLTQTTVKYFVVAASAFGANTTVTVTGGSDYSLANAAITLPFYSYTGNPQGYPGWFNWAWNPQGFSANGTVSTQFAVNGRLCTMAITITSAGTSNATTFTFTAPITAASGSGGSQLANVIDNSTNQASPGIVSVASGGTTATVSKTTGGGAFTNAGTKGIQGLYSYPI